MIDIAYPLRSGGSLTGDSELRYSLRSVACFVRLPIGELRIFGYRPPWLRDAIVERMSDRADKALNLRAKYEAMVASDLSDPFLLLDDDHIFLAPTDAIPCHARGTLAAAAAEVKGSRYGRYMTAALDALVRADLPTRNYQIHYPILVAKDTLRQALALMTEPMVMASLYGNIQTGPTTEVGADFKLGLPRDLRKVGAFVSLMNGSTRYPEIRDLLAARLPDSSRWEG